jgi:hypothetical protein
MLNCHSQNLAMRPTPEKHMTDPCSFLYRHWVIDTSDEDQNLAFCCRHGGEAARIVQGVGSMPRRCAKILGYAI